jgi:hypothetical protein
LPRRETNADARIALAIRPVQLELTIVRVDITDHRVAVRTIYPGTSYSTVHSQIKRVTGTLYQAHAGHTNYLFSIARHS